MVEDLRAHVERCADHRLHHVLFEVVDALGEAKVGELVGPAFVVENDENVGRLEIAMYDAVLDELSESVEDIDEELEDLLFSHGLVFFFALQ